MKLSPLEVLLVLGIVVCAVLNFALAPDVTQPGYVFAPEMMESPAYSAFEPNPNFPDGKTLQRPSAGTIARGFAPLHVGDVLLDVREPEWEKLDAAQRAAWDRLGPGWQWPADPKDRAVAEGEVLRRGAELFQVFCTTCHGPAGAGDGLSVKRGVPPPKAFTAEDIKALSDGHMFRSITIGKGNMASYASQVSREDRWKVIRYIRSLQQAP